MSLYDLSIPIMRRGLDNMAICLGKGTEHIASAGLPESTLLDARLIDDMHPLTRQYQFASDAAKNAAARLSGSEAPSFPDTETTIAELQQRLAATIAYLDSIDPKTIVGREDAEIVVKLPSRELRFTGLSYVQTFALANFFFHETMAYAILRHKGVPLGKMDFIGALSAAA